MKLGIIGGLGPMATTYFMEMITEMTLADKDQDHIEMIVISKPDIPDRTAFILGKSSEDPLPPINEVAERLVSYGADVIAIPCITAHCFHDKLCANVDTMILNAVYETTNTLKAGGIRKAGIMATDGTVSCELFQNAFRKEGIEPVVPDPDIQALVMSLIYDEIKAGKKPSEDKLDKILSSFREKGAEKVVLGCTELSLLRRENFDLSMTVDAMEELAKASIRACGKEIREEYL